MTEKPNPNSENLLIEPEMLASAIDQDSAGLVVFDCRFSLANKRQGFDDYLLSHVPGAYYLDLEQDLSGPVMLHGGRHPLPDANHFAQKLNTAGVRSDTTVVMYDADGSMAPRAWWLLRYLGHKDVRILNGGFHAWKAAGLPLETTVPAGRAGLFQPKVDTSKIVSVEDVEAISAGHQAGRLIDSRAKARYLGEIEPIDPKAGHIPGAVNQPFTEGLDGNGRWLTASEQQNRFRDIEPEHGPLVVYCGSGVTACANLFALELSGIEDAKLYPGSFSDWCSYPNHTVDSDNT